MTKRNLQLALTAALLLILAAGCGKKKAPPPPPPPPPAPAPAAQPAVAFFTAEPASVEKGQPASLRWSVTNATDVRIDQNIGQVSPNGRRSVYPTDTTTYTLTASGGGGSATATATVTVTAPPAPQPTAAAPKSSPAERIANEMKDLHFDYDRADIRPDDQPILQADATTLKSVFMDDPSFSVTIEGHCDERGSAEYNVGLGDRRASAVRDALVQLGVPTDKLKTVSYGKERPLCTDATEDCYQRNRRAHFAPGQ